MGYVRCECMCWMILLRLCCAIRDCESWMESVYERDPEKKWKHDNKLRKCDDFVDKMIDISNKSISVILNENVFEQFRDKCTN